MKTFKTLLAASLFLALAVGCTSTRDKESMLSAAGFRKIPADTPQRQAHLNSLPPDKITPVQSGGTLYYTFPDPKRNVLYVGQEAQYQEYQELRYQDQVAMQEKLNVARMNQDDAWFELWGPWNEPAFAAR